MKTSTSSRRLPGLGLALTLLASTATTRLHAQMLLNSSFENPALAVGQSGSGNPDATPPNTITIYNNASSFNAAAPGNTGYGFPNPGFVDVSPSYTDGPLTFSATTLTLNNNSRYGNGQTYLAESNSAETISLSGASAVSFLLGTVPARSQTIAITINGTLVTNLMTSGGAPGTTYIGFTDSSPITSLTFTNTSVSGAEIDLLFYQVGGVVPEPSTWALLGLGSAGALGLTLRRRAAHIARVG